MKQEWVALFIVAVTAFFILKTFYRKTLVQPLSQWFLKRGKVGIAMRLRHGVAKSPPPDDCCSK